MTSETAADDQDPAAGPELCPRCGDRLGEDAVAVLERRVCPSCADEPNGHYIRSFRRELETQGSEVLKLLGPISIGFAIFGLIVAVLAVYERVTADRVPFAETWPDLLTMFPPLITWLVLAILLHRRRPFARFLAIPALPLAFLWPFVIDGVIEGRGLDGLSFGRLAVALFILAFPLAALFSPAYRLAFGLEVSDEDLETHVQRRKLNPEASMALNLGLASLIPWCGMLALAGIPAAIVGMRKVDEEAWPPVRLRGSARLGLLLNVLGLIESIGLFAWRLRSSAG